MFPDNFHSLGMRQEGLVYVSICILLVRPGNEGQGRVTILLVRPGNEAGKGYHTVSKAWE